MGWNSTLGPGKKTREWNNLRAKLNPRFEQAGITSCEFNYEGCYHSYMLTYAHGRKRLNLKPGELETLVALACIPCHQKLEAMPEEQMTTAVQNVIAKRICQP